MASIADASAVLLKPLDPSTIITLKATTSHGALFEAYIELARHFEIFKSLAEKVREISSEAESDEDQFTLGMRIATMARLWVLAEFVVRDR